MFLSLEEGDPVALNDSTDELYKWSCAVLEIISCPSTTSKILQLFFNKLISMASLSLFQVLVIALYVLTVTAGSLIPRAYPSNECTLGTGAPNVDDCRHAAAALITKNNGCANKVRVSTDHWSLATKVGTCCVTMYTNTGEKDYSVE
jgi:hypothetical protein